jgi:hypothetical protein
MYTQKETLKHSALSLLKIIQYDVLRYACLSTKLPTSVRQSSLDEISEFVKSNTMYTSKISEHLTFISSCIHNYAYINEIENKPIVEQEVSHIQAMNTWKMIATFRNAVVEDHVYMTSGYKERNYLYCIAIWNSAYQILYNDIDVYDKTSKHFMAYCSDLSKGSVTYGDERTEPLFKLIAQIGNFHDPDKA